MEMKAVRDGSLVRNMLVTAVIERESELYVSHCPELDIASQGKSVEEAVSNLREALDLFFEAATTIDIEGRFQSEAGEICD